MLDSLSTDDPEPYTLINAHAQTPVLLICDHASHALPQQAENLGLEPELLLNKHVAWDIGAAQITHRLAERLQTQAVLSGYSRLLIDCNRQIGDPTSIPAVSDGITVPGNQAVSDVEAAWRADTFFWPYHHEVSQRLAQLWRHGPPPALVSIHTFTPYFNGLHRPWDLGVLWNHDPRIALPLMKWFAHQHSDLYIGDNEPYSGREVGFTVEHHAGAAGLPHVTVEIRQDLVSDDASCQRWGKILGDALEAVLSNASLHQVEHY